MVVTEVRTINGLSMNYTYSNSGAVLRCGRLRYKNAADPVDVHKAYFEEGVTQEEETNESS